MAEFPKAPSHVILIFTAPCPSQTTAVLIYFHCRLVFPDPELHLLGIIKYTFFFSRNADISRVVEGSFKFIYLFIFAVLGLRFCARAFSSCGERGPLFITVRGPLTITASLIAEHRLQTRRLSSCGSRA